ncbi:MAG: hypothetical protein IJ468_00660 [Lachnospiraceae bacterium]|nr:hypothetical protein [Lachnospiraceae bacterium]
MMDKFFMLCLLIPMAVEDIREQKLNFWWMIFWGMAGVIWHLIWKQADWMEIAAAFLPGIVLLTAGLLGKGVGVGDGILFLAIGGIGMAEISFRLLMKSLFLCAGTGLIIRSVKRADWNLRLPFAPFAALGYLIDCFVKLVLIQ